MRRRTALDISLLLAHEVARPVYCGELSTTREVCQTSNSSTETRGLRPAPSRHYGVRTPAACPSPCCVLSLDARGGQSSMGLTSRAVQGGGPGHVAGGRRTAETHRTVPARRAQHRLGHARQYGPGSSPDRIAMGSRPPFDRCRGMLVETRTNDCTHFDASALCVAL